MKQTQPESTTIANSQEVNLEQSILHPPNPPRKSFSKINFILIFLTTLLIIFFIIGIIQVSILKNHNSALSQKSLDLQKQIQQKEYQQNILKNTELQLNNEQEHNQFIINEYQDQISELNESILIQEATLKYSQMYSEFYENLYIQIKDDVNPNAEIAGLAMLQQNKISSLVILNSTLDDQAMYYLSKMQLESLSALSLKYIHGITGQGYKYLSDINAPFLQELRLGFNYLGDSAIPYITYLLTQRLFWLDLSGNNLTSEGIKYLTNESDLNLLMLLLNDNDIGDEGLCMLSQKNLSNLIQLDLRKNLIGPKGVKCLCDLNLPLLQMFYISENSLGTEVMKYFFEADFFKRNIRNIALSDVDLDSEGLGYLLKMQMIKLIIVINLNNNYIGNEGMESIAQTSFPKLRSLSLKFNKINKWPDFDKAKLPSLLSIQIRGNEIDDITLRRIRTQLPKVEIITE